MRSFKNKIQDEMDKIDKTRKKNSGAPRYTARARVFENIKMYCAPTNPKYLTFSFTLDLVEQLMKLRDSNPNAKVGKYNYQHLKLEYRSFATAAMPAFMVRLAPSFNPQGATKLTKVPNSWRFRSTIMAKKIRIRDGVQTKDMEYIISPKFKGLVVIIPDNDYRRNTNTVDPNEFMNDFETNDDMLPD